MPDVIGVLGRVVDRDAQLARMQVGLCRQRGDALFLPAFSSRRRAMISQTSGPAANAARRS
ncbi:MAG: hypothetical protein H0W56_12315 [Acidothermales bacterium]|nr:hypothetical protein [Acidothermales bacterium]